MLDLRNRIDTPELMDTHTYPLPVMERTLGFLRMVNQSFGGVSLFLSIFEEWAKAWNKNQIIRILDVGTGGAEIPCTLVKWARKKGLTIRITAIDIVPEIIQIARINVKRFPEIEIKELDIYKLPNSSERFDYVMASLFLHHVPQSQMTNVLRTLDRLAIKGLVIGDLYRSPASYRSVKLLALLAGNAIVRHDGPLSVRRSFREAELVLYAQEAGLGYLKTRREPWFRVSLSGEKPHVL